MKYIFHFSVWLLLFFAAMKELRTHTVARRILLLFYLVSFPLSFCDRAVFLILPPCLFSLMAFLPSPFLHPFIRPSFFLSSSSRKQPLYSPNFFRFIRNIAFIPVPVKGGSMATELTLYGKDTAYLQRLKSQLQKLSYFPLSIEISSDLHKIRESAVFSPASLLLSAEQLPLQDLPSPHSLILTEDCSDTEQHKLYRFQPVSAMAMEILRYYQSFASLPEERLKPSLARIYLVASPIGRSGKTVFSMQLAHTLSEQNRVLYLSLEAFPSFSFTPVQDNGSSLSDALYYFKDGQLDALKLRSLLLSFENLSYLAGMRHPDDLSSFSSSEIADFLRQLRDIAGYDILIVDTDPELARFAECCRVSDLVFSPIRKDGISISKFQYLIRCYLGESSIEALPKKYIPFVIPEELLREDMDSSSQSLRIFTEELLQKHLYDEDEERQLEELYNWQL